MSREKALQRIAECREKNSTILDLSGLDLKEIPGEIGQLQQLQVLDASSNQLTSLPPEIGQLQQLQILDTSSNQLTSLPHEIGQLQQLQRFYAFSNRLIGFSPEIGQLQQLQEFLVHSNQLTSLPPEIEQLQQLQEFLVHSNQLTSLPPEIEQLQQLQLLDVSFNRLTSLPPEILHLNLPWRSRSKEERHDNEGIYLLDNPLASPPMEVVRQGREAVRAYFERLKKEKIMRYEGKILFVGQGGVGKTSLMKRLIWNRFELGERTTAGIQIQSWTAKIKRVRGKQTLRKQLRELFLMPFWQWWEGVTTQPWRLIAEDNTEMFLNAWDFGGQEIYHATHQFFLTQRSLYLFVWDARQEEEYGRIDYWLSTIQTFAEDSPILIVLNKCEERVKDINLGDLKERYPQVIGSHKVSAKTGEGIAHLRENIKKHARDLPLMGTVWPKAWLDVRKNLEKDSRQQMPFTEYVNLCERYEIDEKSAKVLSRYLHDLGVILHFHEDFLLKDTIILKPEWGTDAVYKIFDAKPVQVSQGILHENDLPLIWTDRERYPFNKYTTLLRMMANFELAFPLEDGKRYVIPELLSPTPAPYTWNPKNPLRFEYHYEFLPAGVFTRFIVRQHESLLDQPGNVGNKLCWKEGAFLHYENAHARVIVVPHKKRIEIEITGEDREDFLAILRREFQEIHGTIKKIEVEEKIPCPCTPDCKYRFSYSFLLKSRQKGKKEIDCQITAETVDIRKLLEGLEGPENKKLSIFLSYAPEDKNIAQELYNKLIMESDLSIWFNKESILGGQEWENEIIRALEKSDIVLVLGSKQRKNKAGFVQKEVRLALEQQKKLLPGELYIIPVRIEESSFVQKELESFQWVDLFPDWELGVNKILASIRQEKENPSYFQNLLLDHKSFQSVFNQEWKKITGKWFSHSLASHFSPLHLSLLLFQIENFEEFKAMGSKEEDCLKLVAEVLSNQFSKTNNFVAYLGNANFAVVLPSFEQPDSNPVFLSATKETHHTLSKQLQVAFAELSIPFDNPYHFKKVSIKIGGSTCFFIPEERENFFTKNQKEKTQEQIEESFREYLEKEWKKLLGENLIQSAQAALSQATKQNFHWNYFFGNEAFVKLTEKWGAKIKEILYQNNQVNLSILPDKKYRNFITEEFLQKNDSLPIQWDKKANRLNMSVEKGLNRFIQIWNRAKETIQNSEIEKTKNLLKEITSLLCEKLPLKEKEENQKSFAPFVGQMLEAFPNSFQLNIRKNFPILFLCKTEFYEKDIREAFNILFNLGITNDFFAILVAFDNDEALRELVRKSNNKDDFIVLGQKQFWEIIAAKKPIDFFTSIITSQIDLMVISPYKTAGPVPENMFFGREQEIKILQKNITQNNYLLLANRQVGKTSFMFHVVEILKQESGYLVFYINLQAVYDYESFYQNLYRNREFKAILESEKELKERERSPSLFFDLILLIKQRNRNRQIVLFFDEVDELLSYEEKNNEMLFKNFRLLSEQEKIRFVFSGTTTLVRRCKDPDSPLFNFCEEMKLGVLDPKSAKNLITLPMHALGIRFEDQDKLVDQMISITGGHPNLLQFLCAILLETVNRKAQPILKNKDLEEVVFLFPNFQEHFQSLIWGQSKIREKLIVYLMWDRSSFSKEDVEKRFEQEELETDKIESSLEVLQIYSIFNKRENQYSFAYSEFKNFMIKPKKIQDFIQTYRKEVETS